MASPSAAVSISSIKIEAGVEEAADEEDEADHQQVAYFMKRISDLPDKWENSAETPALSPRKEVSPPRETTLSFIYQLLHRRSHLMTLHVCHMGNTLLNIGSVGVLDEAFKVLVGLPIIMCCGRTTSCQMHTFGSGSMRSEIVVRGGMTGGPHSTKVSGWVM